MSIELNQCTARTLVNATGIPHELAQAIVKYRKEKQNSPIKGLQELWNVPGMNKSCFLALTAVYKPSTQINAKPAANSNKLSSPRSAQSPGNQQREPSPDVSPKTTKNRKNRKRKKNKKKQAAAQRANSPSQSSGQIRKDANNVTKSLNSKSLNRRRNGSPISHQSSTIESGKSFKSTQIRIPNLFMNSDQADSPQNTLIRLTGGSENRKVLAPYQVQQAPDGNGLIVTYKEATEASCGFNNNPQQNKEMPANDAKLHPATFPQNVEKKNMDILSDKSTRSRSRKSTTSPIAKRSRSNPTRPEYSEINVNVLEEWGSVVPFGPGSSTLKTDISIPVNEAWSGNNHHQIRQWLAGVQTANIIDDSTGKSQTLQRRATSADSRRRSKSPEGARRCLDFRENEASTSGQFRKLTGNYRSSCIDDRRVTERPNDTGTSQTAGIFQTKTLTDTWKESGQKTKGSKTRSRSRHKSRHRWKNQINPARAAEEDDERRPIESRLDRTRDKSMGVSEKARRVHKHAHERHRKQSRARSRIRSKRRFCSIM